MSKAITVSGGSAQSKRTDNPDQKLVAHKSPPVRHNQKHISRHIDAMSTPSQKRNICVLHMYIKHTFNIIHSLHVHTYLYIGCTYSLQKAELLHYIKIFRS